MPRDEGVGRAEILRDDRLGVPGAVASRCGRPPPRPSRPCAPRAPGRGTRSTSPPRWQAGSARRAPRRRPRRRAARRRRRAARTPIAAEQRQRLAMDEQRLGRVAHAGRWVFALTVIASAFSGSAVGVAGRRGSSRRPRPAPERATCSSRKSLSPSPPRGITTSHESGSATNAASSSRLQAKSTTASTGSPASSRPARTASMQRRRSSGARSSEPRRMHALPDLSASAATSTVTFGRAS